MAPLFVGIDISGSCLRVAALEGGKETLKMHSLSRNSFSTEEELVALLRKVFKEDLTRVRRVVTSVPAGKSFFRRLSFPFADSEKITQAIPFELGSHLPVDLSSYLTSFQKPVPCPDGRFNVPAAAVPLATLETILAPYEKADVPLHVLDLAPFAYVPGLESGLRDCLLVCVGQEEVTVSLIEEGAVVDFRLWPLSQEQKIEEVQQFIHTHAVFFKNARKERDLSLCLIGSQIEPGMIDYLKKQGHLLVLDPLPKLDDQSPESDFFPALLLAAGAYSGDVKGSFNFRKGPLASKNDWPTLKKQFIFSGSIAVLAVCALIVALTVNYVSKAGALARLDKQVKNIYQETFPGSKIVVDAPLQMQSHLQELEKKAAVFNISNNLSPLEILKEVSARLKDVPDLDLRNYYYNPEFVRLEGTTTSFEAINRMSGSLKNSSQFGNVEITEAKMSLNGRHVNFRVQFTLNGGAAGL